MKKVFLFTTSIVNFTYISININVIRFHLMTMLFNKLIKIETKKDKMAQEVMKLLSKNIQIFPINFLLSNHFSVTKFYC